MAAAMMRRRLQKYMHMTCIETIMGQLFSKPQAPTITLVGFIEGCEGLEVGTLVHIKWYKDCWPARFSMTWEEESDIESTTVEFEDLSGLLSLLGSQLNVELAHQKFEIHSNCGFDSDKMYGAADKVQLFVHIKEGTEIMQRVHAIRA